jgi:DNA polymerase I
MKRLLIDGDQFLFKATAAVEHEIRWDEQNHVLYSNEVEAWGNFEGMLKRIFERFEVEPYQAILCFTSSPSFRAKLYPEYKAHRQTRKPLCYGLLRKKCEEFYAVQAVAGLEADDVMGILATAPNGLESIIVSEDKDMKTIPTSVWDGKDLITYTEAEANYWHLYQTLVGDKVDGFSGCPGVGPVKAEKILDTTEWEDGGKVANEYPKWPRVVEAYKKAGLTEEDALLNARLARILRWSDWDLEKKEPILWSPH